MLSLAERRRPFAVATVVDAQGSVPGKIGATMIVTDDGRADGTIGGAGLEEKVKGLCLAAIAAGEGGLHSFDLATWKPEGLDSVCGGTVHIAIQAYPPVPHLLLFGGGHCGKALAGVAGLLEWDVTVVDGRADFAEAARYADGTRAVHQDPAEFAASADLSDFSHVFLLGHSHDLDARTLKELLPRFDGFVGAIGSQAKWTNFRQRLLTWGIERRRVDAVTCPIGAPIGAQTPEEIAVAVAAQVVESIKKKPHTLKVRR